MRERRDYGRRGRARAAGALGVLASIGLRLLRKATHRPVDSVAILGAVAASVLVIVNAIFLQSGPRPPFLPNPSPPRAVENRPHVAVMVAPKPEAAPAAAAHATAGGRTPQPVAPRRGDPIADLISASLRSSARLAAVQRVLSAFGYGQIRPSGILDGPTSAAIEKFESEHKMPVTGRMSDRLLSELGAMAGHPIE